MTIVADKKYAHLGETFGCSDHDRDLVHELGRRLDTLWRVDQYIANAEGRSKMQEFWRGLKRQEQRNIDQIKHLLADEVRQGCF